MPDDASGDERVAQAETTKTPHWRKAIRAKWILSSPSLDKLTVRRSWPHHMYGILLLAAMELFPGWFSAQQNSSVTLHPEATPAGTQSVNKSGCNDGND